jgi:Secretion system C-terminal sorting domain/Ig-like domain CHU_C associated
MIKNYTYLLLGIVLMPLVAYSQERKEDDNPSARADWERRITKDPKTGAIPKQELEQSRNQMVEWFKVAKQARKSAAIPNVKWTERGPNNVGGRTRALLWDPNDADKKKVWAGGVAGGLWFNNDITDAASSWTKVSDLWDNISVSWIASDPTNTQTLYVATGERSASDKIDNTGGSGSGGGGIWQSTDDGKAWKRLASTIPNYADNDVQASWREIYKVVVTANGDVLALTLGGVFRSKDKGEKWEPLAGENAPASGKFGQVSDIELATDGILYIAEGSGEHTARILKSTNDKVEAFTVITPEGTFENGRVEISLAPSTKGSEQVIYAVSAKSGVAKANFFLKSKDAGASWKSITVPVYKDLGGGAEKPFMGDQGSYDLILGTHDTKPDVLYAAGVGYSISTDGGETWLPTWGYGELQDLMHVDNHAFMGRPGKPDEAVFGNDGGVYYAPDWASSGKEYPKLQKRNKGYNVTQYFAIDLNPVKNSGTVVGGTQDNGSHSLLSNYNTISSGTDINGGDGGLTFIDKIDTNIVITSYTHVTPRLHKSGAIKEPSDDMEPRLEKRGQFINPADYDSPNHTYYADNTLASEEATKVIRYKMSGKSPEYTYKASVITFSGAKALDLSFLKLGKIAGVLYIGTSNGEVYKTKDMPLDGDSTVELTKIMNKDSTAEGNVSCIDFGKDENTIIVTKSNYNITSIFYSTDAGKSWISKDEKEHGLPNMPIRYAFINPKDNKQVMLATELGIWSTTDITASNPKWEPNNETLANVRCDMIKYRDSDETLIVGTHGRGVFSTQINLPPCALTAPIARDEKTKFGTTITLEATCAVGVPTWYETATSTKALGQNTYTTPELSELTDYFVACEKDYCASPRTRQVVKMQLISARIGAEPEDEPKTNASAARIGVETAENPDGISLKVYPNPTTGLFSWELMSQETVSGNLILYNTQGQEQKQQALKPARKHAGTLDLSAAQSGIYLLKIRMGEKEVVQKIIKN